jgi:hypothetical protein
VNVNDAAVKRDVSSNVPEFVNTSDGVAVGVSVGVRFTVGDGLSLSVGDGLLLSVGDGLPLSVGDGLPLSVGDGLPLSVGDGLCPVVAVQGSVAQGQMSPHAWPSPGPKLSTTLNPNESVKPPLEVAFTVPLTPESKTHRLNVIDPPLEAPFVHISSSG